MIKSIKNALGIDGAISYTVLGKGVGVITTVFTVFFIARFLSPEEQGYYYTFASILSIQVFFELGLNNIITQFVAHEASYLTLENNGYLSGNSRYRSRLASLLRFCIKWYCIFALIMLIALVIAGAFFFQKYSNIDGVVWKLPWILLAVSSVINFLTAPINSFMQGLQKVKEIAQIRFYQQLVIPLVVWGGLYLGLRLYVSGLQTLLVIFVNVFFYWRFSFFRIITKLLKEIIVERVNYIKEIFPYQWKIALSWISGYFTFQLFNPVLFATEGATSAGQMGMTISAATAIQGVLLSWINTKVPLFSGLIEQKKYEELDKVFSSNFIRIMVLALVSYLLFVLFIVLIQSPNCFLYSFGNRFLPLLPLVLMSLAIALQIPVTAWATYLRCHLQEPFLLNSVVLGIVSLASALILGKLWGTIGLSCGYLCIQFISVIWAYQIYKNKKREWHIPN